MEAKNYALGNISLHIEENADIKANKCPYITCDKFFFKKSDLHNHLMMNHNELIERTSPKLQFSKTFNTEDITQIQIMVNRQRIKKYAMLISELFEPKEPSLNKSIRKRKEETPKLEAKPRKKSVVITFRADPELYAAFSSALITAKSSKSRKLRELMQKYLESVANAGGSQQSPAE